MLKVWQKYKIAIVCVIGFLIFITVVRSCEKEPKIVTKTVTKIVTLRDTIKTVTIKEVPKIVYVNKYVNVKGDKVIVYVDKPTDSSTIKANQYDTEIRSNNALAKLQITTSGELLDVQGVIEYPKETVTTTITKTKAQSGLFLFSQVPINANQINAELGLLYQFKNSVMVMGGLQYNEFTKRADIKVGLGIKLF